MSISRAACKTRLRFALGFMGVGLLASVATIGWPGIAEAAIKCRGAFQINKYGPISTLYCQNRQIAKVARTYGWKVTGEELGDKPLKKLRICQTLGNDVRMQGACNGYQYPPGLF